LCSSGCKVIIALMGNFHLTIEFHVDYESNLHRNNAYLQLWQLLLDEHKRYNCECLIEIWFLFPWVTMKPFVFLRLAWVSRIGAKIVLDALRRQVPYQVWVVVHRHYWRQRPNHHLYQTISSDCSTALLLKHIYWLTCSCHGRSNTLQARRPESEHLLNGFKLEHVRQRVLYYWNGMKIFKDLHAASSNFETNLFYLTEPRLNQTLWDLSTQYPTDFTYINEKSESKNI
jgi:hypothetical protein